MLNVWGFFSTKVLTELKIFSGNAFPSSRLCLCASHWRQGRASCAQKPLPSKLLQPFLLFSLPEEHRTPGCAPFLITTANKKATKYPKYKWGKQIGSSLVTKSEAEFYLFKKTKVAHTGCGLMLLLLGLNSVKAVVLSVDFKTSAACSDLFFCCCCRVFLLLKGVMHI